MSSMITPRIHNPAKIDAVSTQDEWVEIIEPKSKTKIYANLQSGVCAKSPPEGVPIRTTNDFSDHWWELFDKKSGKYYYYNPDQQKTVWTKPISHISGDSRKLLIIPVSKLKTSASTSTLLHTKEKCDVSTQTVFSNLVSTGTQTVNNTALDEALKEKLSLVGTNSLGYTTDSFDNKDMKRIDQSNRIGINIRQNSDLSGKNRNPYLGHYQKHPSISITDQRKYNHYNSETKKSSQKIVPVHEMVDDDLNIFEPNDQSDNGSYFGPAHTFNDQRRSMRIQGPVSNYTSTRANDLKPSTTTFKTSSPTQASELVGQSKKECDVRKKYQQQDTHQMVTNNLSQYLVREARAMGIALISDDEVDDDDDHESEDDCHLDDEDTDPPDDLSSNRIDELNASQELGEDSSEGWKSLSDTDSPNGGNKHVCASEDHSKSKSEHQSSFLVENLVSSGGNCESSGDRSSPAASMSQQLDHKKLVENFKKSRQNSALGFNDSLRRSCKLDASSAVQRIKTVADSYFHPSEKDKMNDRHLRNLSTISTLPRHVTKIKEDSRQETIELGDEIIDADYDLVEENCSYYSDSDRLQNNTGMASLSKTSPKCPITHTDESPTSYFDRHKSTRGSTFSVESFARENLTRHPKGGLLFNRKVKWSRMISWTKNSIRQPMISSVGSDLSSDSIEAFKLIQQFMGDRKVTIGKKYRQVLSQAGVDDSSYIQCKSLGRSGSLSASNKNSSTSGVGSSTGAILPDRLRDELAYELAVIGCTKSPLRDEIFVQLARQLTENPDPDSVSWGLILMSILLSYFSPSTKFAPFLLSFLEAHSYPMARDVCLPRLEKRLRQSWLSYCRKPADGKEISIVRLSITKWPQYCGIFGESLEKIMILQACSPYLKTLRLPWILTSLAEMLDETGGFETEGIFRCAADHDLLAQLRLEIDCVDFRKITDAKQVRSLLSNVRDPHVIAGLLKLFFRQLLEPVFPTKIYDLCLQSCQDIQASCRIFNDLLPNLNKDVVAYLIRLLQHLSQSQRVVHTKMDTSNLSMVWAPNLLRSPEYDTKMSCNGSSATGSKWSISNGEDHTAVAAAPSQSMIFEQTRQEMQFIKALIAHLDTSFIADVR